MRAVAIACGLLVVSGDVVAGQSHGATAPAHGTVTKDPPAPGHGSVTAGRASATGPVAAVPTGGVKTPTAETSKEPAHAPGGSVPPAPEAPLSRSRRPLAIRRQDSRSCDNASQSP